MFERLKIWFCCHVLNRHERIDGRCWWGVVEIRCRHCDRILGVDTERVDVKEYLK